MAYETGTTTSSNDLLDKVRLFALTLSWTVNRWVTAGSGKELCIQKGSAYYNLRSYSNESATICGSAFSNKYGIAINGSDGYSAGLAWDRQTGYPVLAGFPAGTNQLQSYMPLVTNFGPFPSYHLFSPNADNIHLELEVEIGKYLRLGFGSLDLFNPATAGGGRYFYATGSDGGVTSSMAATSWLGAEIDSSPYALEEVPFRGADITTTNSQSGSYLRAAFDSFDNWCTSCNSIVNSRTAQACQGGGVHDKILRDSAPNPINGIGFLTPNVVSVNRSNTYLNPVGVVPGIRYMDMTNYQPGDEFSIGADTWKVFPWYQKSGRSFQRGIAYKKVP